MSDHIIEVSPEAKASNDAWVKATKEATTERRIKRHSTLARITHAIAGISCILLVISGLFVFVPQLNQAIGQNAAFAIRMCHRVIGVIFVAFPIFSAIASPKGVGHVLKNLFAKWTKDDKKWMILFFPYLFLASWIHMPDQDESKSGQRIADGAIWIFCLLMAFTGVMLIIFSTIFENAGFYSVMLTLHDIGFLGICVFGMAHIFLGAGIFQPYRKGVRGCMYGDGTVSEEAAIYHWGHWAREELASGSNVIEVPKEKYDKNWDKK